MPAEPERLLRAHPHHPQVGARHSAGEESPQWKLSNILVSGQPDHTFGAEDLFWPIEVPVVKFISAFMKEKNALIQGKYLCVENENLVFFICKIQSTGNQIPMRKKMCKEYQISGMPRLEIPTQLTIGGPPPCTVPQPHTSAYL